MRSNANPVPAMAFVVVAALALPACSGRRGGTVDARDTRKVEVRIDDSVIAKGDPMEVIDPVWWQASIYDGWDAYERTLAPFSQAQRYAFAILWYDAEVNNGGHSQLYANSTGIVWRDALAGFDAIGLPEGAAIVRESAGRIGGNPALDREERNRQLEALAPKFDDLDERYYALGETVNRKLMEYIRSRPQDFYFSGVVEKPAADTAPPGR
jgi:hypothetical protein